MIIWISREVPLFNFQRLDILCLQIGQPFVKIGPFEYLERFRCSISSVTIYNAPESDICVKSYDHLNFSRVSVVQFRTSRYIMSLNRTYVWKVMTIWISREIPLFNFKHHDILWPRIRHPSENLWTFEFLERFRCSISNDSIYYVPELDIHVKSYDHLNFSRISVVPFQASWYIVAPNQASVWKIMTIWISRELPLYNFERLDMWCDWIGCLS